MEMYLFYRSLKAYDEIVPKVCIERKAFEGLVSFTKAKTLDLEFSIESYCVRVSHIHKLFRCKANVMCCLTSKDR